MVISDEIKFPRSIKIDPYRPKKKVDPVDGLSPIARVGAFTREWRRWREERRRGRVDRRQGKNDRRQRQPPFTTQEESAVRRLVQQVNNHLGSREIPIHLLLTKDERGYSIDVYDCTGNEKSAIIGDVCIALDDLPVLLKKLQQEAGILLDTIS